LKKIKIIKKLARYQWLILVILAFWQAEIWRIKVQDHPGKIAHQTSSPNNQSSMDCKCSSSPALQTPVPPKKFFLKANLF
jgi:hypothetical protein